MISLFSKREPLSLKKISGGIIGLSYDEECLHVDPWNS